MTTSRILALFLKYSILIVSFDIYGLGRERNRTRSCLREWYPGNAKTARECRSMRRSTALFRLVNTICWEPDLFMKCKEASVWQTVLLRRCPLAMWAGIRDLVAPALLGVFESVFNYGSTTSWKGHYKEGKKKKKKGLTILTCLLFSLLYILSRILIELFE